ncbi:MAG: hypothetical protein CMJ34_15245 [Phycisphaerae bacterium]|nr:hypothetical protein [Phycisphaerae bacterium]
MSDDHHEIDPFERRILAEIETREPGLRRDLAELVAMPTGHNHVEGLDRIRDWFATRLGGLGAEVTLVPGRPRPDWLAIRRDPEDAPDPDASGNAVSSETIPPMLLATHRVEDGAEAVRPYLCGHLDTVHDPAGSFQSLEVVKDGIASGPGAMDMKGGLVVALGALEALAALGRRIDWTMGLVSDEETGTYFGEHALIDSARGHDVGLVFEPALADGSLVVERMGSGTFMIEAFGRAAHVGRAFHEGRSAVVALSRAIVEVSALADPANGRIVNIGPVHGGGVTNAVPHHARCWGNARYADPASQSGLEADIHRVVEELDRRLAEEIDEPARIRVRTSFIRPAKPSTPEVLALADCARRVSEALGHPMPYASTGGACDGNLLQAAGVPTIDTLGVRGGGMHRPDEYLELDSIGERTALLAILLHRLDRDGFGERKGSGRPIP